MVPVPVRPTLEVGVSGSLDSIRSVPPFAPEVEGKNCTSTAQELPALKDAGDAGHVSDEMEKLSSPVVVIDVMLRLELPVLVIVTVRVSGKPVQISTLPNAMLDGLTAILGGICATVAVPETLTVTGFSSGSFDGISKLSPIVPKSDAVGENLTVNVQLTPGANVWFEQVSVGMLNANTLSGSALAIAPITRFAAPSLVIVTVSSDEKPCVTLPKSICRSLAGATESVTVISGVMVFSGSVGSGLPTPHDAIKVMAVMALKKAISNRKNFIFFITLSLLFLVSKYQRFYSDTMTL